MAGGSCCEVLSGREALAESRFGRCELWASAYKASQHFRYYLDLLCTMYYVDTA